MTQTDLRRGGAPPVTHREQGRSSCSSSPHTALHLVPGDRCACAWGVRRFWVARGDHLLGREQANAMSRAKTTPINLAALMRNPPLLPIPQGRRRCMRATTWPDTCNPDTSWTGDMQRQSVKTCCNALRWSLLARLNIRRNVLQVGSVACWGWVGAGG